MPIDNIYRKMDNFYKKLSKTHISQQVFLDKSLLLINLNQLYTQSVFYIVRINLFCPSMTISLYFIPITTSKIRNSYRNISVFY